MTDQDAYTLATVTSARPIEECSVDDLTNHHALVYGRCRVWTTVLKDAAPQSFWSRWAWWKAMHYSHRGSPKYASSWGIYSGESGYSGPGDAQITHFLPMPGVPSGAPIGEGEAS